MPLHVYFHDPETAAVLLRVEKLLQRIIDEENKMATDLSALTAQVKANTDAEAAAAALITGLAAELHAAATDPAAVKALADQLSASAASLSAAVVANTPSAPPAA